MKLTSDQIKAALFERLAQLNEVSDWGYITITVSGSVKEEHGPNFEVNVSTRNTELSRSRDIDKAVRLELDKHSPAGRKSEAEKMREHAEHLLKQAAALEGESLAESAPEIADHHA